MMPSAPVSIFLSIHGDSEFLREFLDSLAAQTCRDFTLRYRFDGPVSPQTEELMKRYPFASGLTDRELHGDRSAKTGGFIGIRTGQILPGGILHARTRFLALTLVLLGIFTNIGHTERDGN